MASEAPVGLTTAELQRAAVAPARASTPEGYWPGPATGAAAYWRRRALAAETRLAEIGRAKP